MIGTFNNLIGQNLHDTLPVPLPIIIASYHRLRDDAVSNNLLSYNSSTKQFHDVPGRSQLPYLQQNLFAASPAFTESYRGNVAFICDINLIWNNTGKTISQLEIDFDNGEGFLPITFGQEIAINYYSTGNKAWTIKAVFTDSTVWQCYSNYKVHVALPLESMYRYQPGTGGSNGGGFDIQVPFSATTAHSGADVYIAYTNRNRSNTLRKPLIVVEGYDVGNILPDIGGYTYMDFIDDIDRTNPTGYDFNNQLDDVAGYDIVFVDFKNGTDNIEDNAALLEEVIAWVNNNKVLNSNNGNIMEDNVVLGISMGGLVARYALANMTKNSVTTQTRLLITHDSPHRGANVPLGLQYLVRMTGNVKIFGANVRDIYPEYDRTISLLEEPATQQMLIYRSVSENTFTANTFLDGQYRTMVTFSPSDPQPSYRFIATSNGSECGNALFAPYQQFLTVQAAAGLSVIVASYKFRSDIRAYALPNSGQTSEIAKLYIKSQFKILFFNVSKTLFDKTAYAPGSHLPIDGAPGGTSPFTNGGPVRAWFNFGGLVAGYAQGNPTNFCFVPTVSALDINTFNVSSLSQRYVLGVNSNFPSTAQNYIANESSGLDNNISHTRFTARNASWLYSEMENVVNTINCSNICPPSFSITGPSTICSSETYEVPNLPSGATVTWSTTGPISISGSNTANPVTVTKTANGTGTLTATVGTACGDLPLPVKNITAGLPNYPYAPEGEQYVTVLGDSYGYEIPAYPGAISYDWYVTGGDASIWQIYFLPNAADIVFGSHEGYYYIQVKITTECGEMWSDISWVLVDYSQNRVYSYFPNPVKNELTVTYKAIKNQTVKNEAFTNKAQTPVFEIKLMGDKGLVLKSARSNGNKNSVDISTKDIPDGTYYLHIINNGKTIKKQVVVQH